MLIYEPYKEGLNLMLKKLLIVEDSKPIARVIKQIAMALNYEATIVGSMAELKELLHINKDFFVATVDFTLPDATDGEAIAYVLSQGIPSVVMTGKMDEETRQKILSQPVIDYITKENSQAFLYLKRILHSQLTNGSNGILVVDDSSSARTYLSQLLQRRNFKIYVAEDGLKALEILKQHHDIKLVITDLEMPVMDGIVLTNEIRKLYSREQLTIIGISGTTNGMHSARFIKNGADDFLRKPFCPEEFYCRITQNIENLYNIEQIQKAANTDYLTKLPNRRAFFQSAEDKLAEYIKQQTSYCLCMLDIDFFKKVNDTYGHDAGDHVLKILALYLRKYLGAGILARLGGEEFAVLLSGIDSDQLYNKLEDFRRAISVLQITHEQHHLSFTVSLGVVFNSAESLDKQMIEADTALYEAKENGRNQICIAGSDDDE